MKLRLWLTVIGVIAGVIVMTTITTFAGDDSEKLKGIKTIIEYFENEEVSQP
jgi:ABC-type antimicrobial peptide transport system permease subunit